jgi:hypothetical protein
MNACQHRVPVSIERKGKQDQPRETLQNRIGPKKQTGARPHHYGGGVSEIKIYALTENACDVGNWGFLHIPAKTIISYWGHRRGFPKSYAKAITVEDSWVSFFLGWPLALLYD